MEKKEEPLQSEAEKLYDSHLVIWENVIKKLENTPMDRNELTNIRDLYLDELELFRKLQILPARAADVRLHKISIELLIAFNISLSKWKDKHPAWYNVFFNNIKMPDINVGSLKM